MTDLKQELKKYNSYLEQIEMVIHPNLYNGFLKIHNRILELEIEKAKNYKPDIFIVELDQEIKRCKEANSKEMKKLILKNISSKINEWCK